MNMHHLPRGNGAIQSMEILGVPVASLGWNEAIELLSRLVRQERFTKVGFMNAHNANLVCSDSEFATALEDFLILPDGVGVDMAANLFYGRSFPANLNGTDFIPAFLEASTEPLSIGLLGATRHNAEEAARQFARLTPQHRFVVIHDGYFAPGEESAILDRILDIKPQILLVAMGVPRQELWISRHITSSHCILPFAVGALLDFMSGSVPRAPKWMRRMRMEWVFRLVIEPGRLWRRYIIGNPLFLSRVFAQKIGAWRSGR